MVDEYLKELKTLIIQPVNFSSMIAEKTLNSAYRHYVFMLVIFIFFFGILTVTFGNISFTAYAQQFSSIPIIGYFIAGFVLNFSTLLLNWHIFAVYLVFIHLLFGIFILGFFLEMSVLLVGGEQGYVQTTKTLMYAATPALLLGWIPWIWIPGCLWSLILLILGIEATQRVNRVRAIVIVAIPVILCALFLLLGENVLSSASDILESF
jgi:hypothetical protein